MAAATSSSRMLLAHRDFSRNLDNVAGISASCSCNLTTLQDTLQNTFQNALANITRSHSTLDDLLPPRNLYKNHRDTSGVWRPASSIYSDGDNYTSPISPNFANVAARNTYTSAVADISPPSSPDMEAHRDG